MPQQDQAGRPARGESKSSMREAECKDCRREVEQGKRLADEVNFSYNEAWAAQQLDRGGSRSDRCREHRQSHQKHVQGMAVAYIDLETVGPALGADDLEVGPTGPLGGLGPLPGNHELKSGGEDLGRFGFGMDESHIREMLSYLENDDQRILVVKAGTGTGKSTYMPYRLLDPPEGCFRLCDLGPIVVTEPRVQATMGVAGFVGQVMSGAGGVGPGYPVGYQVSGDRNHDAACQLIFVTDGTVINWMREGRLNEIGTIIVDEAHERSTNIDFILGFLKQNMDRYQHLRVIVTSATFNADFYVEYFAEFLGGAPPDSVERSFVNKVEVPAQKSIGYGFPLFPTLDALEPDDAADAGAADRWATACPDLPLAAEVDEDDFLVSHWKTRLADPFTPDDLSEDTQDQVGHLEDLHDTTRRLLPYRFQGPIVPTGRWKTEMPTVLGNFLARLVTGLDREDIYGDVLAFLPTTDSIEEARAIVTSKVGDRADVFALLSSLSAEEKADALDARRKGDRRKVVISSNLAETSLTVEGVRFVVDSGLICQETWEPESASRGLPTVPHSQSGIKQRWGRVGRKAPGWVFPLYTKGQFVSLPEDTPPGSTRSNLESLVMTAKMGGIDDIVDFPWPAAFQPTWTELDESAKTAQATFGVELLRAKEALKQTGAVDPDGDPTSFGKELTRFQGLGSTASAVAIMYADRLGCVPEVTTLLALLEGQSLAGARGLLADSEDWPPEWRLEAVERHDALFGACEDDAEAVLQIVAAWERSDPGEAPWIDTPARAAYAGGLWLNHERLLEMAEKRRDVLESLSPAMKEEVKRFVEPALLRRARGVLTRAMGVLEYRRDGAGAVFHPVGTAEETTGHVSDQSRTVSVADRIIPLARYRDPRSGEHSLSNIVTLEPWATRRGPELGGLTGPADAIDLLLDAAEHARPDSNQDVLAALLLAWPPGTRVQLSFQTVSDGTQRPTVERIIPPARLPAPAVDDEIDLEEFDEGDEVDADPGLDTSWPAPNDPIVDNEDLERRRVVDTRPLEALADACGACDACLAGDPELCESTPDEIASADVVDVLAGWVNRATLKLDVTSPRVVLQDGDFIDGEWYEVVGFEAMSVEVPAVVLRQDWRRAGEECRPGEHPDLAPGQVVTLRVGELRHDHRSPVRILYRTDGHGRFALREADNRPHVQESFGQIGTSLDRRYEGLVSELHEDAILCGTALPRKEADCYTVTLLELLHQHVVAAHRGWSGTGGSQKPTMRVPAVIDEVPNAAGYGKVRLTLTDSRSGIHHSLSFRGDSLRVDATPVVGDNVEVHLRSARARLTLDGMNLAQAGEIAEASLLDLELKIAPADSLDEPSDRNAGIGTGDDVLQSLRPVSAATCRRLEALAPDDADWRAAVWVFFARSHHLSLDARRGVEKRTSHASYLEIPARLLVATTELEEALVAIPAAATVVGFVVDADSSDVVINLTPSVSAIIPAEGRPSRPYVSGDPVIGFVHDRRPRWGELGLSLGSAFTASAPIPDAVESIVRIKRKSLEADLEVTISISGRPPTVHLASSSPEALDQAVGELGRYLSGCAVNVAIPEDKKGVVLGKRAVRLHDFQQMPGILYCNFGRDEAEYQLLVGAETTTQLHDLLEKLEALVSRAPDQQAQMVVPEGKNGVLIGRSGATIKAILEQSGCTSARALDNGSIWVIKGPTKANVEKLVELAGSVVPGCHLQ